MFNYWFEAKLEEESDTGEVARFGRRNASRLVGRGAAVGLSGALAVLQGSCAIRIDADDNSFGGTSRVYGSGELVAVEADVAPFSRVEFSEGVEAVIAPGDESSVSVLIDNETVIASVTLPRLTSIVADDDVAVTFSGFEFSERLTISVTYEGLVEATSAMVFDDIDVELSDDSGLVLLGEADFLSLKAVDECSADLANLVARAASVVLDEESSATVNITEILSYDLDDESTLLYYGNSSLGTSRVSEDSTVVAQGAM